MFLNFVLNLFWYTVLDVVGLRTLGFFVVLCKKVELLFIGGNLMFNLESDLKEVFFLFWFIFFGVIDVMYGVFLFILFLV